MGFGKHFFLFIIGGCAYVMLEFLWRGWSHGSMFFAGGSCFLLLGTLRKLPFAPLAKGLLGAAAITAVELAAGLLINRNYEVWDYRNLPGNFHGQVCLSYFFLWIPVSLVGMALYHLADKLIN